MAEDSGTTVRTINIEVTPNAASSAEAGELVDGITQAVVGAAQSWQERMKERAAKSAQRSSPLP